METWLSQTMDTAWESSWVEFEDEIMKILSLFVLKWRHDGRQEESNCFYLTHGMPSTKPKHGINWFEESSRIEINLKNWRFQTLSNTELKFCNEMIWADELN